MGDTDLTTRPEGIRTILRRALAIYRARPSLYLALVSLPIVPVGLAIVALGLAAADPSAATERIEGINLVASTLLITPIAQGAVAHAVVAQLDGRAPTFAGTLRAVLPRSSVLVGSVLLALVLIPLLVPIVWFALVGQVVVLEEVGFGRALRRCRELARGRWWRTFFWILVIGIVAGIASLIVGLVVSALVPSNGSDRAQLVVPLVAAIPANIIALPFETIALTLIYLRLRDRAPA